MSRLSNDPTTPVDDEHCMLLGPTALSVQAVMGVLVVLSLVYKRQREKPMRPWRIWLFDVSKQVVGQMVVHTLNIGISDLVSRPSTGNNPCTAYFINVIFDVTVGVGIIWTVLHGAAYILTHKLHLTGFESGSYGHPPSFNFWLKQASVYVMAVVTMKFFVGLTLALVPFLFEIGDWLLSWTKGDEIIQIVFVMGLFPIIMNILQFWIIDTIVKDGHIEDHLPVEVAPDEPEPLLDDEERGDSDMEDTASVARRRRSSQAASSSGRSVSLTSPQLISTRSTSATSEPKSIASSLMQTTRRRVPSPINVHDYPPPPSRQTTPVASPRSQPRSLLKRSPPPSPSPICTPTQYGATSESPRMRESDEGAGAGWAFSEDKDEDARSKASGSMQSPKPSKESWHLPVLSPTRPSVPLS